MVVDSCAPPRVRLVPKSYGSRADDVFEMAEKVKFEPDEWQRIMIEGATGVRKDGKWAAKRVAGNVPRQNGKGGVLELIELTALYVWLPELPLERDGDRLAIHSAHEFITSRKHFDRIWGLVENTPSLLNQVVGRRRNLSHGAEGFKLKNGSSIEFRTRTKGGGRGFSCDFLVLDEAMFLSEEVMGALLPTLRARPNPQIWYTGSAVDQEVHDEGHVFTRIREEALKNGEGLAYFEWSLPYDHPDEIPDKEFFSEESMWLSNPAYGIRIFKEHFEMELKALDRRTAAVELYGVGDYPDPDAMEKRPISSEQWAECEDKDSKIVGPVCFGFDVSPERRTSIAAAGRNQEGRWHVEVIEKMPGTGWLPAKLVDLEAEHDPEVVACDSLGPAASVAAKVEELGVTVKRMDGGEYAQACGRLVDAVSEDNLRHLGSIDLWNAIRSAGTRPLSDRWVWSRKKSAMDISPLVAATLALWAAIGQPDDDGEGPVIY